MPKPSTAGIETALLIANRCGLGDGWCLSEAATIIQQAIDKAQAWQPISTAPKDGTLICIWADYMQDGPWMAYWFVYKHRIGQGIEGWNTGTDVAPDWAAPTHWMPLPQPPQTDNGGE